MSAILSSVVSGLLLILIFPKFSLSVLAWVALVPFFIAIPRVKKNAQCFAYGLLAGYIYFGGTIYWIPRLLMTYGGLGRLAAASVFLIMITVLAIFIAVFGLVLNRLYKKMGPQALWMAPFAWVSLEFARNYLAVNGFPWCLLGYSQVQHLPLIQIADLTGAYGVSFLIVSVNALIVFFLLSRSKQSVVTAFLAVAALLASSLVYGHTKLSGGHRPAPQLTVACIQGNIPITDDQRILLKKFLLDYPKLIRSAANHRAGLIILPESPTPMPFQGDPFHQVLARLVKEHHIWLLFNYVTSNQNARGENFNSAYLLNPAGELSSRYDKMHLVPFGEYVPLRKILFFAGKVLNEIGDFKSGASFTVSRIDGIQFATLICFESIFPELAREFVRRGAEFLVIITNDSWYGYSAAPYQHFDVAVFRSIENRRYLVRAANSGLTGIIDPSGRVLVKSDLFRETVIQGDVTPSKATTLYTRFGDVFAWFCVIITFGAFAYSLVVRKQL